MLGDPSDGLVGQYDLSAVLDGWGQSDALVIREVPIPMGIILASCALLGRVLGARLQPCCLGKRRSCEAKDR